MSDEGYTATEALAALAILGLAVGGLTSGLKVIGVGEAATAHKVTQTISVRTAATEMAALVRGQGPFRSDDAAGLTGDVRSLSFPCGGASCSAKLTSTGLVLTDASGSARTVALPNSAALQFSYLGSQSLVTAWPPAAPPPPAPQWQVLRTIFLSDAATGEPVLATEIVSQQTANCQYDGILRDCRKDGA
jgi:hypothetical protein